MQKRSHHSGLESTKSGSHEFHTGTQWLIAEQASLRALEHAKNGEKVVFGLLPEPPHPAYPLTVSGIRDPLSPVTLTAEDLMRYLRGNRPKELPKTSDALKKEHVVMAVLHHAKELSEITGREDIFERANRLVGAIKDAENYVDAWKKLYETIFRDLDVKVDVRHIDDILKEDETYWQTLIEFLRNEELEREYAELIEKHPIAKAWKFSPTFPFHILLKDGTRITARVKRRGNSVVLEAKKHGFHLEIPKDVLEDPKKLRNYLEEHGVFLRPKGPVLMSLLANRMKKRKVILPGPQYFPVAKEVAEILQKRGIEIEPEHVVEEPKALISKYKQLLPEELISHHEYAKNIAEKQLSILEELEEALKKDVKEFLTPERKVEYQEIIKKIEKIEEKQQKRREMVKELNVKIKQANQREKEKLTARRRNIVNELKQITREKNRIENEKKRIENDAMWKKVEEIMKHFGRMKGLEGDALEAWAKAGIKLMRKNKLLAKSPEEYFQTVEALLPVKKEELKLRTYSPVNLLTLYLLGVVGGKNGYQTSKETR